MTNERVIELLANMKNGLEPCASLTDPCLEVYQALDKAIKALEDVAALKRAIILLAVGGIPPEKQLIDFGYTREDWVYMLKTVMEIIEENIICANSEDSKGNNNGNDNNLV